MKQAYICRKFTPTTKHTYEMFLQMVTRVGVPLMVSTPKNAKMFSTPHEAKQFLTDFQLDGFDIIPLKPEHDTIKDTLL